ncbi:MAG: ATP-binding protein [Lentilactobacillus sunkii]|jgi:DNA repair exonuclease SbcCD ATPase subunit|uniref:ATP-binding protein n=1 Tax=Lentilactobacillus sunkii TaxID=481719 RepID=UPI002F357636
MKQIKLISISYHHFKGIQDFQIEPDGKNVNISGKNAVGKTTLFDGFLWLLFGKNSAELSKFNPKPLDDSGREILGLEPEVEATLDIDGKTTTLRRKLSEVWSKPRGQAEKIRKSDKTELYVDEVPYKLKDYTTFVNSMIDEDSFKLLTNPMAFNNLKWQERREILLSLIKDVNDDAVIKETSHPDELKQMLGDHTAEEQRKIIAAQRHKLRAEIDGIPARIDEANRAIPETSSTSKEILEEMLKTYHEQLNEEQANLQALSTSTGSLDARNKKAELETELNSKQASYQSGFRLTINSLHDDLSKLKMQRHNLQSELNMNQQVLDQLGQTQARDMDTKQKLLDEYHEVNGQTFDEESLTCPTCGQAYPKEKQDELREKFNTNRSERLATIIQNGKEIANRIKDESAKATALSNQVADQETQLKTLTAKVDQVQAEYNKRESAIVPFEQSNMYQELQKQIAECDQQIQSGSGSNTEAKQVVQDKIDKVNQGITDVTSEIAKYDTADAQQKRMTELKDEEKLLKQTYSELDKKSFILDEYVRTKVQVLEKRINSMFGIVNFKLFETQKNGEINDVCEAMVDGVPYSTDLNNAARINAGLDIINTLSKHYQVTAPIFIDNAESVNQIIQTDAQQIKLIVSKDEKLTAKVGE